MKNNFDIFDAIVIGSGAGGSVAFSELVEQKVGRVLLIEEGSKYRDSDRGNTIFQGIQKFYRDGGLRAILSNVGVIPFGEGRVLGGGTQVNGGLFWQTPDVVLDKWREEGSFTDTAALKENIRYFEKALNVSEEKDLRGFDIDSAALQDGAARLGLEVVRARRATSRCVRSNRCAIGCPSRAKNSTNTNLIPDAQELGGEVLTEHRVLKLTQRKDGFLECLVATGEGTPKVFMASRVYIAAGPLETPALIARSSPLGLGSFPLALHLNAKLIAKFPGEINAHKSTIFTRQFQDFESRRALLMATAHGDEYVALSASSLRHKLVREILENEKGFASFTVQIAPENYGRLLHFAGKSLRIYRLDKPALQNLKESVRLMARILFEAGAERVILPLGMGIAVSSTVELEKVLARVRVRHWKLTSVHAMSSVPLPTADRASKSRVSRAGRLRGFRNVFLCCASVLPSHTIESPQATIMGMSKWIVGGSFGSD